MLVQKIEGVQMGSHLKLLALILFTLPLANNYKLVIIPLEKSLCKMVKLCYFECQMPVNLSIWFFYKIFK